LYYRKGAGDKVYTVEVVRKGRGWVVNVEYGRRGGTMKEEARPSKPVPRDAAEQIYAELLVQKVNKGYMLAPPSDDGDDEPDSDDPAWDHPDLGRFTYDGSAWTRFVDTPGFKSFRYGGRSNVCELSFEADDEGELPSRDAVAVARRVLANHEALATKVAAALWDDFTGKGPDSGMYWHGNLEALAEGMEFEETLKPPRKAADVPKLMQLTDITIPKRRRGQDKPLAELNFTAAYEDEHGVGILTDGKTIVGIGYSSDVTPFKKKKAAKAKPKPRPKR
jgi:hypothetical protein